MKQTFWGIDLGGTKIEGVVMSSLTDPTPLCRLRIDTQAEKGYAHILQQIRNLLDSLSQSTGLKPTSVGIGHPGVLDPKTQKLKNSNTTCLNGATFLLDTQSVLELPVTLGNDANCFALAESYFGAGAKSKTVFGIIMGTGVGGGIVIDKQILVGHQGIAGEWGHNVIDPNGPECYCGKSGCVETILSGPALEKYYAERSTVGLRLPEIIARAKNGDDEIALLTMNRLIQYFGKALAVVVNILDPDCIVLGGGVSNIQELYTFGRDATAQSVFNDRFETPILSNVLGDSAGVFGAAMLTAGFHSKP